MRRFFVFLLALTALLNGESLAEKTAGMKRLDGYFPLYWDEKAGKLFLEIERWGGEFLYVNSLPAGLGSNDVGLDRGQIGDSRIVRFERSGPKVLLVQPNYGYRATTENPAERRAVEEAFAQSVLWGFQAEAEESGRVLVDATSFFLRDAHGIPAALQRSKQGTYRLDASRSALYLPRTKNFPDNTEVEAILTFTSDQPGPLVRSVAPDAEAVTLREHHSLVKLPGPGFEPRPFDPRAGYSGIRYMDYAAPIGEPVVKRFIARHRLKKKDRAAAISEPVAPIVYYLDPGVPEPVRSALLDGARWWVQAFEAAGYRNAFRVELLPEGADPMDVRYNLIQWVHRSTRGWSYGRSITDPRTGEIIKGRVTLGSLRVRQDYLIAEGLLAPYESGRPAPEAMERMALARLRQLSAHEVGHTLGLSHNYIASARNRASVMDYPHPLIDLPAAGPPDLSRAYTNEIGPWDQVAIQYGYTDFPPGTDVPARLDAILEEAAKRGLVFLSDADARPEGSAHPANHLWDNGGNAVDELKRLMAVRGRVLERFGERNIREGAPMSTLEDVLAPVYLLHRYQTEAAAKVLGGVEYTYAMRGDGQKVTERVPPEEQRRALDALLATLDPAALTLPPKLLSLIPPRPPMYGRSPENFRPRTGLTFDALAPAEAASNLTVRLILHPQRAGRLVEQHAVDPKSPGLEEIIDELVGATWKRTRQQGLRAEVQRVTDGAVLYHLMALASDDHAARQARAVASRKLEELRAWMTATAPALKDSAQRAHLDFARSRIERFQDDPKQPVLPAPLEPPPGQPIGMED
jgi:hypothetical protein